MAEESTSEQGSTQVEEEESRVPELVPTYQNLPLRERLARNQEMRDIIEQLDATAAWDHLQSRDLDPRLIDYVAVRIREGYSPAEICRDMGLRGGKASRQWKKIQAHFRQGFRADAEAYLMQQTEKYYRVLERAKEILDDAFENGTPHVVVPKEGHAYTIRVKGATKELGSFLESYSRAIALPVKLWKDYGAIAPKSDLIGQGGTTIVVENHIPMPSLESIKSHQEEMRARAKAISVDSKAIAEESKDDGSEP